MLEQCMNSLQCIQNFQLDSYNIFINNADVECYKINYNNKQIEILQKKTSTMIGKS